MVFITATLIALFISFGRHFSLVYDLFSISFPILINLEYLI